MRFASLPYDTPAWGREAQAWRELAKSEQAGDLSFEERMALLVDRQFTWRQNEAFEARRIFNPDGVFGNDRISRQVPDL